MYGKNVVRLFRDNPSGAEVVRQAALQTQLLELLRGHPPHLWSTGLLAVIIGAISMEVASKDVGDGVSGGIG